MKLNKLVALLFLVCSLALKADDNTVAFDSANTAYTKGNYEKSIKLYEGIISKDVESFELYFNLGNAYYKTNNIGLAILNYERAKKLNPNNEDLAFNLKLATQKTEDKIDTAPQLFIAEWENGMADLMSERGWSMLCILFVFLSLIFISGYILSQNNLLKKVGFYGGIILIIVSILTFFTAQHKYNITKNSNEAIITSTSVTANSSPDDKGTKLFILHEGTKVSITQENNDWSEVKIANGNIGWIKTKMLTSI
jgi:tetratricopeptide (TPR) repeat protein